LQEHPVDPQILAKKAEACAEQGAKIVELSHAKISQGKKLGGLLLGIAGVLLIAASIAFAVVTHLFGTPIAIAGISLGASYIASIGGVGIASGVIGVGFFATRKPNEIQLQEALDNLAKSATR
jgi:predicted phage tail protein